MTLPLPARRSATRRILVAAVLLAGALTAHCSTPAATPAAAARIKMAGPLVASSVTMVAAWQFPRNPLTDTSLDKSRLSDEVRRGFKLFTSTPAEAPRLAPGGMSCTNCHLNGGQRERSLPLVGVSAMFPEYNNRSARLFSLGDRISDCFLRSENATGGSLTAEEMPTPTSSEVLAIDAYLTWLAKGTQVGRNPSWRGQNAIAAAKLLPIDKLDVQKGQTIYADRCVNCHGPDGQGVEIGDKKAGPLWGPNSWNDGAGAARVYTLAGMIRYSMPYLDPGNISDEDAQQVAAFIDSKPRPAYPFKDRDYKVNKLPADAVYYRAQGAPGTKGAGTKESGHDGTKDGQRSSR
jgi:thiosulfate dehydrogenase